MPFEDKHPDIQNLMLTFTNSTSADINMNRCLICKETVDSSMYMGLTLAEWRISRMCARCQNIAFEEPVEVDIDRDDLDV